MCTKSGSPPVPNQTSTAYQSATSPSSVAMPYYQNFLANASNLSQTPFNPAMLGSVAPLNPTEFQAGQFMTDAMGLMPGAVTNLMNVGQNLGTFDPTQVRAIESPYTQDVVQATQDWFNNQNAIQGTDLMSQAIRTGNAFGGDRAGIAEAQLAGQQQLAQAPVIAGLRQAGYTQALNEYNQLKQMGLAGAQAELGAPMAEMQGAGALMGWGAQQQAQAQKELDVAQQNAMMASAYPFQTANWYGSILGGVAPLTGSFAQGYTTPPPPNVLGQAAGIASAIAGLGSAFAGKHGGPVPALARGGLVPIIVPRRFVGGPVFVRRQVGGLVPVMLRGGGLIRTIQNQPGTLGRRLPMRRQSGGSTNIDLTGGSPAITTTGSVGGGGMGPTMDLSGGYGSNTGYGDVDNPDRTRLGLTPLSIPQYKGGPPDAGDWIQKQMRAAKGTQQQPGTDLASTIGSVAKLAVKAAPLFALLKEGGAVKRYADGDSVDDDDDDEPETTGGGSWTTPVAQQMVAAGPGPDVGNIPTPTPRPPAAGYTPDEGEHEPGGIPTPSEAETGRLTEGERTARAQAGLTQRGGGGYGVRQIPRLGRPAPTFSQRLANNPLWNLGMGLLSNRSPYLGPGVAAGMAAMSGAAERQRKEDLLDQKPQLIDDGKKLHYRVGNKLIDTGIASPKATGKPMTEYQRERLRQIQEKQDRQAGGRGAPGQVEATNRFHMRQLQKQLDGIKDDPDRDQKAHDIVDAYNKQWGTTFNVPQAPAAGATTTTPGASQPGAFGRLWNWLSTAVTGSSAPAPAKAEEKPAQEQQPAAPAARQQQGAAADPIARGQDLKGRIERGEMTRDQAIAMVTKQVRESGLSRAWADRMLKEAGLLPPMGGASWFAQ